jgi:hypothetical protein
MVAGIPIQFFPRVLAFTCQCFSLYSFIEKWRRGRQLLQWGQLYLRYAKNTPTYLADIIYLTIMPGEQ